MAAAGGFVGVGVGVGVADGVGNAEALVDAGVGAAGVSLLPFVQPALPTAIATMTPVAIPLAVRTSPPSADTAGQVWQIQPMRFVVAAWAVGGRSAPLEFLRHGLGWG